MKEKEKKTYMLIMNSDAGGWKRLRKTKQCGSELWTVRTLLI